MSTYRRILFVALGSVAGLAAIVLGVFVMYRWARTGEVLGTVSVGETQLSGLAEAHATDSVLQLEDELMAHAPTFRVNGAEFQLQPITVEFDVDEASIMSEAMSIGRQGSLWAQFQWWLSSFGRAYEIPLTGSLDEEALDQVIDRWEVDSGMELPFDGAITIQGTDPVVSYPRQGMGVIRADVPDLVLDVLLGGQPEVTVIPIRILEPALSETDLDRALARARKLLSGPVTLQRDDPEVSVTFTSEQLAEAFYAQVIREPTAGLAMGFDVNYVDSYLNPIRSDLEAPPRDAQLVVDADDNISILPSRPGTLVDPSLATEALEEAAATFARLGEFPFEDGAQPVVSTADLEALGVEHLVSQFTTYHSCCQVRVQNIHLFADEIDGALVLPGETFSLNEYAGPRTGAEGYQMAGTIIAGELQDTIGGGVSQFATTFYNAVFWGGFEDVDHKPHSLYFTRYPEGIEATISWPAPNLVFLNDTSSAVLIKTAHTDTSITVKFFGSNGGRTVVGEQRGGQTIIEVVNPGVGARIVSAELSGRSNFRTTKTIYVPDPELDPDDVTDEGYTGRGWTVGVTRRVVYPDGTVDEDFWTVRYSPPIHRLIVHPCKIPEGEPNHTGEECPTETTTTIEGGTTVPPATTIPPPTTVPPPPTTTGP